MYALTILKKLIAVIAPSAEHIDFNPKLSTNAVENVGL